MSGLKKIDLGLKTAYDELFMDDKGRAENRLPKIYNIPLTEIDDFPNHPFQVRMRKHLHQGKGRSGAILASNVSATAETTC